jgi:hypothetical protein
MSLSIPPSAKWALKAAALGSAGVVAGWVMYWRNMNVFRRKLRESERRKRKGHVLLPHEQWSVEFQSDWEGEDLVIALEAALFPRGGSVTALARSPQKAPVCLVKGISFAGGGFRTISYVGQLIYLEKRGMLSRGNTKFYGASLGAMFAAAIIIGEVKSSLQAHSRARAQPWRVPLFHGLR